MRFTGTGTLHRSRAATDEHCGTLHVPLSHITGVSRINSPDAGLLVLFGSVGRRTRPRESLLPSSVDEVDTTKHRYVARQDQKLMQCRYPEPGFEADYGVTPKSV